MSESRLQLRTSSDLVEHMQVVDIIFYRCSLEFDDAADQGPWETVDLQFITQIRPRLTGVDYRCKVVVPLPTGDIVADAAIIYDAGQPIAMTREAVGDFGNRAALMALYPYLRQAVSDLSSRLPLRVSPLPLLPAGDVAFSVEDLPENIAIEPEPTDTN